MAQMLGALGHLCGVKMMSSCHGWDWQPPQTASCIHIKHMQSVWAHWYAVHGYAVAALHSYTHTTWLKFWSSGLLVEWKRCQYVMVETDSHLKLLPTSISKIKNCLSTLICCPWVHGSSLKQLCPHYLDQIPGFWVNYGVKMLSLHHGWSWQPPQTASCIHIRCIQSVWAHWYAVHGYTVAALHSYPPN